MAYGAPFMLETSPEKSWSFCFVLAGAVGLGFKGGSRFKLHLGDEGYRV